MTIEETFARFKKIEREHGAVLNLQSMHDGVREWRAIIHAALGFDSFSTRIGEGTSRDMEVAMHVALDAAEKKLATERKLRCSE